MRPKLKFYILAITLIIVILIVIGYFYGHNSRKTVISKFKHFSNHNSDNIAKLFEMSNLFVNDNQSLNKIGYEISNKKNTAYIVFYDSSNKKQKSITINKAPFFRDLVISPPYQFIVYSKASHLKFKEAFTDFSNNVYSLLVFQSDSSKQSFFQHQNLPVYNTDSELNAKAYYLRITDNCYLESK